jgi:hypothetical protein
MIIAPQPGNPAIDAIPNEVNSCGTTITTDQRGISQPQGPKCDIGAYEVRLRCKNCAKRPKLH